MPGIARTPTRPPAARPSRVTRGSWHPRRVLVAAAAAGLVLAWAAPAGARGADVSIGGASGGAAPPGVSGRSAVSQQAGWMTAKAAHRLRLTPYGTVLAEELAPAAVAAAAVPVARRLATVDTALFVEPPGSGADDRGVGFTDRNYWNFCAPGAAAIAAYYFGPARVTGRAAAYYAEPYGPFVARTWWASADSVSGYATKGRSYLMYMAEQVTVPGWPTPGLDVFTTYPTIGAVNIDIRDALNWEISGHAANWVDWYYILQPASGSRWSEAQLHSDITWDIGNDGRALVAAVDTAYLPNWSRSIGHSIAIVGYDDAARTYAYMDTCGRACNGSSTSRNGGVHTVSQHALYLAIASWGTGYVW